MVFEDSPWRFSFFCVLVGWGFLALLWRVTDMFYNQPSIGTLVTGLFVASFFGFPTLLAHALSRYWRWAPYAVDAAVRRTMALSLFLNFVILFLAANLMNL